MRETWIYARPFEPQAKVILEYFVHFWRKMPAKWHQERANGHKNGAGLTCEGSFVAMRETLMREVCIDERGLY